MFFTLRNQRDPTRVLNLTLQTWYSILDLADLYGWTPFRAFWLGDWQDIDIPWQGYDLEPTPTGLVEDYDSNDQSFSRNNGHQLVILEDALNLADALEEAFHEYEPVRVPPSFYLFEPEDQFLRDRPSIGAITAVIEMCQSGPFWIESHTERP